MTDSIQGSGGFTATAGASQSASSALPQQTLGQEDFFTLMTAQLKNQDPNNPLDGREFLAQLAQFSTLNGIQELQKSFETLAQSLLSFQTSQAADWVGKSALVESARGYYSPGQPLAGEATVTDDVGNLTLKVYDGSDRLVHTLNLGAQPAGQVEWSWNGASDGGGTAAAGVYRVTAEASVDGQAQQFGTQLWNQVRSIVVGQSGQGARLQLAGVGDYPMSTVREIR
ncbi:MAG TPA: flagellar hook assembly protein FlgD [Xanthomonadaceae bacterium]|nr:flagellar hook assembly protein FlgD [Xanthomonadaceae bacterium]